MKFYPRTELRAKIWKEMSPERRDYDRWQGFIPEGESPAFETAEYVEAAEQRAWESDWSCSCHINPPCSFCIDEQEPS